jgi:hypothetical protein
MKKQYKITITEADRPYVLWKVELKDHNGNINCVYEKTHKKAMQYALYWIEKAEERQHAKEVMNNAIMEAITLDQMAGITTSTSDSLD